MVSVINAVSDVNNTFLDRREIICDFAGLGGKLKKLDAIDMITKEFKLDGKIVIPINMTSHVGKPLMTGTFYVYEDETNAKKQVNPTVFARLEKARKKLKEAQEAEAKEAGDAAEEATKEEGAASGDDTAAAEATTTKEETTKDAAAEATTTKEETTKDAAAEATTTKEEKEKKE